MRDEIFSYSKHITPLHTHTHTQIYIYIYIYIYILMTTDAQYPV